MQQPIPTLQPPDAKQPPKPDPKNIMSFLQIQGNQKKDPKMNEKWCLKMINYAYLISLTFISHLSSFCTWLMQFVMSFFLTDSIDCRTSACWLSWMSPASFLARSRRNLSFTFENVNSIGLYSGLYGTLKMTRKPNLAISNLAFSLLWAERLSRKRAIFSSPFFALSSYR